MRAQSLQPCLTLCNPMDVAHQAPLSMGFSRQEYWSGLLCPPPGDLPNSGNEPKAGRKPHLLHSEPFLTLLEINVLKHRKI